MNDLQAHVRGGYCRELTLPTQPVIRKNIKSPFEFNAILIKKGLEIVGGTGGLKIRGQNEKGKVQYFPCGSCDKIFNASRYLTNHRKTHSKKDFCCPNCQDTFTQKASMLRHIKRTHQSLIMKSGKIRRFTDNELVDYQFESIERSEHGAQRKPEKQQGNSLKPRYPERSPTKDKNRKEDFEISDPEK